MRPSYYFTPQVLPVHGLAMKLSSNGFLLLFQRKCIETPNLAFLDMLDKLYECAPSDLVMCRATVS